MPDLSTTYLGLRLTSPLVVAASPVSSYLDRIRQCADQGAGALVVRSLFEEQLIAEGRAAGSPLKSPGKAQRTYFPNFRKGGLAEHLYWIGAARKHVKIPLIGSLNAVTPGNWTNYARALADAGCDAIELNVYAVVADPHIPGSAMEEQLFDIIGAVTAAVEVPVSVKLSPFYANVAWVAHNAARRGARGLVLFNRFVQPDIDAVRCEPAMGAMPLSEPVEMRLPLRWTALLAKRVKADLAFSTGVHSGEDAAKALLAGAQAVQVCSALLRHGIPHLTVMNEQLKDWMRAHGHRTIGQFRGALSGAEIKDLLAYERAQYVKSIGGSR